MCVNEITPFQALMDDLWLAPRCAINKSRENARNPYPISNRTKLITQKSGLKPLTGKELVNN